MTKTGMRPLALALLAGGVLSLGGCSSFSKAFNWGDSVWGGKNYRAQEERLAESLEVPPTLVRPQQQDSLGLLSGKEAGMLQDGHLKSDVAQLSKSDIPAYRAKGVAVKATLCERWLALGDVDANAVWQGVQKFLKTLGYPISEANRATGIIRTGYVARKEIVPLEDVSPLTRLFNSWRPETAEGALDRFVVHVTVDGHTHRAQIRFHHHQVFQTNDGDITVSRVRPYDPVKELEMLYQAAIFFGAAKEQALKQVKVSAHTVEIVQGRELDGLVLHAPMSESWAYLQSMIWRADWKVEKVVPERHEMVLDIGRMEREQKKGFWSSLAFWRRSDLPEKVILRLKATDKPDETLLTVHAPEGASPLNAEDRRRLFAKLGLLGQ